MSMNYATAVTVGATVSNPIGIRVWLSPGMFGRMLNVDASPIFTSALFERYTLELYQIEGNQPSWRLYVDNYSDINTSEEFCITVLVSEDDAKALLEAFPELRKVDRTQEVEHV